MTYEPTERRRLTSDVFLFIYSPSTELIYSNRGLGRRRNPQAFASELNLVEKEGSVIGYYFAWSQHFLNDRANEKFLKSMSRTVYIARVCSSLIALFFAPPYSTGQPPHHPAAAT